MTIHINSKGVPKLAAGEWALILKKEGDAHPYMIAFGCPCGSATDENQHGYNVYLQIRVPGDNTTPRDSQPTWQWDGNREAPTLTPSIQREGACEWHGYLRAGKFVGV